MIRLPSFGLPPTLGRRDRIAIPVVLLLLIFSGLALAAWTARYAWAIHRVTRGVGDTVFYTSDGKPWFAMDEQRRDVPLGQVSPHFLNAVVAVEDHRFRYHAGIDPIGLSRALWRDLRARSFDEGGSTITQQLARTLFLSNSQTIGRKAQEALLAMMLEQRLSKDEILELYVNRVYLGGGAYGIGKMSRNLFGKNAAQLTLAESALIAGLIQRPSGLSPWSNMTGARQRSHVVLARMRQEGMISGAEESAARTVRLPIRPYPQSDRADNGYAKQYLRQEFRNVFGGDHPPDWKVQTSFNAALQAEAERAVTRGLNRLRGRNLQAALVALRPDDGRVVALVGGRDFAKSEFDRATRSRRQPGSAFKPFVYAAALERDFSPVSMLTQPENIAMSGQGDWRPRNANNSNLQPLTLREAIIESNNRAAVGTQQQIGARRVLSLSKDLGLDDLPDVPSLALGTGLVTPIALTAAYAVFPNGGYVVQPHGIVQVTDANGSNAWRGPDDPKRVLSEETAFQMVSLLGDVIDRGTATAARTRGVVFPAGGKTGTTNDYNDAWFVGFTSGLVVGVWVGFDDPATMGANASGARLALPIWSEFMVRAARVIPARDFTPPATLETRVLCSVSYHRATNDCPAYTEYFKDDDDMPAAVCKIHRGPTRAERVRSEVKKWLDRLGGIFR
ncbi:MAG TPA: PBP1A family penicillin-binding protein [Vicinamibacterales bacterium]|nr:PBP1A family penicillin-binding protein [Vicinamibacterales bacterium]